MRLLTISATILLATGCVGTVAGDDGVDPGVDAPVSSGTSARKLYTTNVFPLEAKCTGGACHDATAASAALSHYLTTDAGTSYDKIVLASATVGTFTSIAPILTKITAGHQGLPAWTTSEQSAITTWLAKEAAERAGTTTTPPADPIAMLKEWSGCMSIANFQTAKMATSWGSLVTNSNQKCENCHGSGAEGFIASSNEAVFFKVMSEQSAYMLKYFTVDTTANKVIVNTGSLKNANDNIVGHPKFNYATNAGVTALQTFYTATMARKTAGTCDPARLVN